AVEMNKAAFAWGRLSAIDMPAVLEAAGIERPAPAPAEAAFPLPLLAPRPSEGHESGLNDALLATRDQDALRHVPPRGDAPGTAGDVFAPLDDARLSRTLDEVVERRAAFLREYQGAGYARRYTAFVARVRAAEQARVPGSTDLTEAVARYFFKLMA